MPRKAFVEDLQLARSRKLPGSITSIAPGTEDGALAITVGLADGTAVELQVLAIDLSSYPRQHQFLIFTDAQNVPSYLEAIIQNADTFSGLNIEALIEKIAANISRDAQKSLGGHVDIIDVDDSDNDSVILLSDDEDDAEDPEVDDDDWDTFALGIRAEEAIKADTTANVRASLSGRAVNDLRIAKQAGFRVGVSGDFRNTGNVLISCRIAKLGIADDTLKAWDLNPVDYLLLAINYTAGYRTIDELITNENHERKNVQMRIALSNRYKLSVGELSALFADSTDLRTPTEETFEERPSISRTLFIKTPLEDLINQRLFRIISDRVEKSHSWSDAEQKLEELYSAQSSSTSEKPESGREEFRTSFPSMLLAGDHLSETTRAKSFPLVAFQFLLRRLVHCTSYCLVCHRRVHANFEALKPYVCSNELCLYQYMSLGFGPSLEHEILTQPYVVDLLVSFCYYSAFCKTLVENRPVGLNLNVPDRRKMEFAKVKELAGGSTTDAPRFDIATGELHYRDAKRKPPNIGEWVFISSSRHERPDTPEALKVGQYRRIDQIYWPRVKLSEPIKYHPDHGMLNCHVPAQTASTPLCLLPEVDVVPWNVKFEDLSTQDQQEALLDLMCMIPPVSSLQAYIKASGTTCPSLRGCDLVHPAALSLLRWIVASNRSCIIQIDQDLVMSEESREPRVLGVDGYMQFRFAQGAPDKEQRFVTAVEAAQKRLNLSYPTIFAWHGSRLENWHSIVREGLHYKRIVNGRASGNGVYHALQAQTSLGYCARGYPHGNNLINRPSVWPSSALKISNAICLNEIVNAPGEFQSSQPHLVVQHLDWIQTRYLFIKAEGYTKQLGETKSKYPSPGYIEQVPSMRVVGPTSQALQIPATMKSRYRKSVSQQKSELKWVYESEVSDDDDQDLLNESEDDLEIIEVVDKGKKRRRSPDTPPSSADQDRRSISNSAGSKAIPKTDFVPGKLDYSKLPMLAPPSFSNTQATKALQRELRAVLKTQQTQPQHELGWYIDPEHTDNMYQWIFELHSFDPTLPLARDLKQKGLTSIVLELRFSGNYPYAPPFVRVVRPRFLPFINGGGGHVTGGGAMCMQLLTNDGWNPASSVESVLLQVRVAMANLEPRPARLLGGAPSDYSVHEAVTAFRRACAAHGWQVPADVAQMTAGSWGLKAGSSSR